MRGSLGGPGDQMQYWLKSALKEVAMNVTWPQVSCSPARPIDHVYGPGNEAADEDCLLE